MVFALRASSLLTLALGLASCSTADPAPPGSGGQSAGGTSSSAAGTAGSVSSSGSGNAGGSVQAGGSGGSPGGAGSSAIAGSGGTSAAGASGGGTTGGTAGNTGTGGSVSMAVSGLPLPPGAGGVPQPSGAVGGLKVLDWAGFKAAVSYTFDDSNSSQISKYPELQALGVPFTFYLQTGKSESTNAVWSQALKDGHELANHTKSHAMAASEADVDAATKFLEDTFKIKVWSLAAPYGEPDYGEVAKTRFLTNRGVNNGLMGPSDNTDPFQLFCFVPTANAPQKEMDDQIIAARSAGKWRVVLVHGFIGGTDSAYNAVSFENFSASVKASKALGDVWLDTVVSVASYWRAQKTFSQLTPTTSGSAQTWTWTLPDHFPPGKFLRVSVTGGKLAQKGVTLPWNERGFYEVALDDGSLTLSP
ncbi:MAG: polysaccharide deacetylase [Myxococcales bacterium]|nr:MAG: polysaccharide deacetylase [Myxococcales bacterium]